MTSLRTVTYGRVSGRYLRRDKETADPMRIDLLNTLHIREKALKVYSELAA